MPCAGPFVWRETRTSGASHRVALCRKCVLAQAPDEPDVSRPWSRWQLHKNHYETPLCPGAPERGVEAPPA
eukprot:scaffold3210_cov402-Prasinococcus_capsulatus_cf.AAC.18